MKKSISWIFIVLSLTLFAGQGFCQPSEELKKPPSKEQIEKIRKKVETLKMWRLTDALELSEETASKAFPVIKEYDKKRLDIEQDMRKDMSKLRQSVDTASEDELRDITKRLEDNHRKLQEINGEEMKKLGDILSVRERAKFIIFKQDFDKEMKNIIAEAKERHEKGLRGRPMRPPTEETPEPPLPQDTTR